MHGKMHKYMRLHLGILQYLLQKNPVPHEGPKLIINCQLGLLIYKLLNFISNYLEFRINIKYKIQ